MVWTAENYQAFFYLAAGLGAFSTLTLGLRLVGQRYEGSSISSAENEPWHQGEQIEVAEIISETHNIKTFRFVRQNGKLFPPFVPGQFLTFQVGDQRQITRNYSISSSAVNLRSVQVAIKKIENGQGSTWFHALKVGDRVWAFPPSGLFTDAHQVRGPRIFVAGGIGITPFLSMLQTHFDSANPGTVHLFYGMRTIDDMAFHGELERWSQRYPRFRYFPVLSHSINDEWSGLKGFLNFELIAGKVSHTPDTHYYFCGPTPMTDPLVAQLTQNGVPEEHIHLEKFASPISLDLASIPQRKVTITYLGQPYNYDGKQTVLEFLEAQGCAIPYSCRAGVCGSCKCQVQGTVKVITDSGLTAKEKAQGLVLTCVAFPESDLSVAPVS